MSQRVFDFIIQYKVEHDGLSPSYSEIGEALYIGKTTVHYHVVKLLDLGLLARGPGRKSLMVTGGRWVYEGRRLGARG